MLLGRQVYTLPEAAAFPPWAPTHPADSPSAFGAWGGQHYCEEGALSLEHEYRKKEKEFFKPLSEGVAGDSGGREAGAWSLLEAGSLCGCGRFACPLWTPACLFA